MWKARPVLAGRVGGIPAQILDGETGVLVDPRDLAAVAERIDELMAEPQRRRALGAAARSRSRGTSSPADSSPPTYGWSSRSWTGESTRRGGPAADPDRALVTGAFQGRAGRRLRKGGGGAGRVGRLFSGRVVWHVNSTARGGGVAEMLQSLLAYTRGAGVDARWVTIGGDDEFFRVTKRILQPSARRRRRRRRPRRRGEGGL